MCGSDNSLWRVYWGLQLRFFGQLCCSAKVHTIVEGQSSRRMDGDEIGWAAMSSEAAVSTQLHPDRPVLFLLRSFALLLSAHHVSFLRRSETQRALSEGYAVVIGLQTTGESSMAHQFAREVEDEPAAKRSKGANGAAASSSGAKKTALPSLFKEMLLRFIGTSTQKQSCAGHALAVAAVRLSLPDSAQSHTHLIHSFSCFLCVSLG